MNIINLIQRKLAGVEVTNHGIFNIATKRGKTGMFVAWGKVGQIESTCSVREPGEHVWFNEAAIKLMLLSEFSILKI